MKASTKGELIVGLVFSSAVTLLGVYTIVISGLTLGATKQYLVDFPEVYGLKEGDNVRVEGHEVGEVTSLRLLPKGGVRAVLEVHEAVQIYKDGSEVRVTPFSPLGGRIVEIERGDSESPRGAYTFFAHGEGVSEDQADVILGTAEGEVLTSINRLIKENEANVAEIVANLRQVSAQLTQTDNVLGYLINEPKAADKLDGIATRMNAAAGHLEVILEGIREGRGVIGGLVQDGSPLQADLEQGVKAGRGALESAEAILARADRGESALGVLVSEDEGVVDDVRGVVQDVRHVTREIAAEDGEGTLSRLVHDGRLYEGAADTAENLAEITGKVKEGQGLLGVLFEEEAGDDARATLHNLAEVTGAINDPEAGTVGLLIHDDVVRGRVGRIAEEVERLVVEFRDSLEDAREQAPVNAFIGAVFAAF